MFSTQTTGRRVPYFWQKNFHDPQLRNLKNSHHLYAFLKASFIPLLIFKLLFSETFDQFQWIQLFKLEKELSHDPFQICYDPLVGRYPSVEKRWSNLYRPSIQIYLSLHTRTAVVLNLFLISVILSMKKIWGTTKSKKM